MSGSAEMTTASDFRFLSDLHLLRRREGEGRLFILQREYRASFSIDGQRRVWTVPAGMATDLASIPSVVPKWIAQKVDAHIEAAVVHDHMCILREESGFTSREAAAIFRAGMEAANVAPWRREAMYRAVLHFGPQWTLSTA